MPFVEHRGQKIHYEVRGEGPTVVFQHGLLSRGASWDVNGYVAALANERRVVIVDSLGHGASDKPADPTLYALEQRAGDLARVFDAVGADRVHMVGYSMGGWMSAGVAKHYPDRLLSLTIGGWSVARATGASSGAPPFAIMFEAARARLPELVAWVTPEARPALEACWIALFEGDGGADAVAHLTRPVLLWAGAQDFLFAGAKAFAEAHGLAFFETKGDHVGAMVADAPLVIERLREHFAAAERRA